MPRSTQADRARALEALRVRYEAGDTSAALEALALCGPVVQQEPIPGAIVKPLEGDGALWGDGKGALPGMLGSIQYPRWPDWLEIALRDGLYTGLRQGEDSLRRMLNVPVASGNKTLAERAEDVVLGNYALGCVLAIQAARKDARRPYPRGEDANDLAGVLLGTSGKTIKRRVKDARTRRACEVYRTEVYRTEVERIARSVYVRCLEDGWPPWPPQPEPSSVEALWDRAIRTVQKYRVNKRRFC